MPYGLDLNALGEALEIKIFQPQRGEKKKLIELAIDNAKIHLEQNFEIYNKQMLSNDIALEQLRLLIQCNTTRIELFDISHISGKAAVGDKLFMWMEQLQKKTIDYIKFQIKIMIMPICRK